MNRRAPPIRPFQPLLAALFMLAASTLLPAATYHPLLTNGPAANRFNVAVLPEGYTAAELDQFLLDAATAIDALLAYEPYREYRACFNAAAIAVASAQSGSSHPLHGIQRDTYFNSSYDPFGDYVITLPEDATGVGKLNALIQQFMPDNDLVILLVNDPAPGGSGGPRLITSKNAAWIEFLVHESGHTVAGLGDEYDYAVPGFTYPDFEFPNTTTNTNPATLKWKAWIEPGTPIPTPADDFNWWNVVGLFEGAQYSPTNWYRPKYDCLMRSVYSWSAFCEVCQESLVRAFYGVVRPVDQHLPATTNLDLHSPNPIPFSLALLQPAAGSVRVQWWTNGVAIPGATNTVLDLTPAALGNGQHRVEARVRDHTDKVRTDPDARLTQVITWHLDVQLLHLRLDAPRLLTDGACALRISGSAPGDVVLLHSTNFATWSPLATNRLHSGEWIHTNPAALASPPSFFRALTRP